MLENISLERLVAHPQNPRKDLGDAEDLKELAESIKEKGILQNLTVVPHDDKYMILIGHRRAAAAELAGLTEVPCAVVEMSEQDQVATMLLENIQRKDLTPYEQAQGFQMMLNLGSTVDGIACKTGFSKATVYHRINLLALDQEKVKEMSSQMTIKEFQLMEGIKNEEKRNEVLTKYGGTQNFKYQIEEAKRIEVQEQYKNKIIDELKAMGAMETDRNIWEGFKTLQRLYFYNKEPLTVEPQEGLFYKIEYNSLAVLTEKNEAEEPDETPREKSAWKIEQEKKTARRNSLDQIKENLVIRIENFINIKQKAGFDENLQKKEIADLLVFLIRNYQWDESDTYINNFFGVSEINRDSEFWESNIEVLLLVAGNSLVSVLDTYNWSVEFEEDDAKPINEYIDVIKDMGFELTEDEMKLLDGTHELYKTDEDE